MKICYLLESTDLWGGVRIVFDQARALRRRGHEVIIRGLSGDHRWYPHDIKIDYVNDLSVPFTRSAKPDVVIATFWSTVKAAVQLGCGLTFHLCQGYEGDSSEYAGIRQSIEDTYNIPVPKLTIGEWIAKRLIEVFGPGAFEIYTVGQIVDLDIYKPLPLWKRRTLNGCSPKVRVLVSGIFEASVKAISDALQAVTLLREKGFGIHLIRVSTVNTLERESALAAIDEYHCMISPVKMADIYRTSNLFIAPSLAHEGFGLPFAEALACGTPSIATAIPSHLSFDKDPDYACFVPEKNPASIAEAAIRIIKERQLRGRLRKRGIEVVHKRFRGDLVAERLETVFSRSLTGYVGAGCRP